MPVRLGPEELVDDRYLLDTFLEHTRDHVYFKNADSRFLRISRALAETSLAVKPRRRQPPLLRALD